MRRTRLALGLTAALLAAGAASPVLALTSNEVQRFTESLPQVRDFVERENIDVTNMVGDPAESPFAAAIAGIQAQGRLSDFEDEIEPFGFDSAQNWADIASDTARAYVALQMQDQGPQLRQELSQARQTIQNNAEMTPEQKQQMLGTIERAEEELDSAMNAPEADREAVRPHLAEIAQVLNEAQQQRTQ